MGDGSAPAPPYGTARATAHDYDGQARNASSSYGGGTGQATTEFQVHSFCQESAQPGDAGPDGGSRWSSATTAGCTRPRPGATNRQYAGSCATTGTEADAGRETVPSDPAHVPRFSWKDHWDVARDRQCRVGPHVGRSKLPQGQGRGSRRRPPGSSGQGR